MIKKILSLLLTFLIAAPPALAQDFIRDEVIPPGITRDAEIIPTGEANGICINNTGTPAPAISLCSTVNLTGKTVLYKIPTYTVATIPAGSPLVVVTDGENAADCGKGGGSTRVVCGHNGSAYVSLSSGGLADPGSNGLVARNALNTLIARTLTGTAGKIVVTNGDGASGNPTIDTGSNVPLKDGSNLFSGPNTFNSAIAVPRKLTPADLSTLMNGEVWVDGELLRFKSNTGLVYTLYKIGDPIVRTLFRTADPTPADDTAAGYNSGDMWINTVAGNYFVAMSVSAGAAQWDQLNKQGGGIDPEADIIWLGQNRHEKTIGSPSSLGPFPPGACGAVGFHGVNTVDNRPVYCKGKGANVDDFGSLGDSYFGIVEGVNQARATGGEFLRLAVAPQLATRVEVFNGTGTFAALGQPNNDDIEVLSSEGADNSQTITFYGTTHGADQSLIVIETITLNGTTPVSTTKTDWSKILAIKLSGATTGTVTVREASGNVTLVEFEPGDLRKANLDTVFLRTALSSEFPAGDDQVFVSSSAAAGGWKTIPNCPDSGGNHLNYTQSTNAFSCGTSGGGAGVTTLHTFRPQQNEPPSSNFALIDLRNGHPILVFDDATSWSAVFSDDFNRGYSGGSITVDVKYACAATSGNVKWDVSFESLDSQDMDSDSFASAQTGTGTCNGTSGILSTVSIAFTSGQIDSIAAGSPFRMKVARDVAVSGDATGNVQIRLVTIRQ